MTGDDADIEEDDLCWCGSGRPFEDCHLGREKQLPHTPQDFLRLLRRIDDRQYCLHPDASSDGCQGVIVRAHTIQRNSGLTRIARGGRVYGFKSDVSKFRTGQMMSHPKLMGIKQASTFTGYCSYHDSTTFEPIERHPFQSSQEHTFLAGYRAICREVFSKATAVDKYVPFMRESDRGQSVSEQRRTQATYDVYEAGVRLGLEEVEHHKALYDAALQRRDFSASNYYVVRFDRVPDFMCSGATQLEVSFAGERLQNWAAPREEGFLDYATFTLTATDTGGIAIFNWLGEGEATMAFIKSLDALTDEQIPHAITRFVFEYFENVYMSPDWWEALDEDPRESLLLRQWTAMGHEDDCLVEDLVRAVSWKVTARESNVI